MSVDHVTTPEADASIAGEQPDERTRWREVLDRIAGEIQRREELLAEGQLRSLRVPSFEVPEDLGPVPSEFVPRVHELVEALATQGAAIERELMTIGRELARTATVHRDAMPRSVEHSGKSAFEARA
jgi:hypothetical protein